MSDRDRLIALINDCRYMDGYGMELVEKQADHLLSNGVIVPPCNVGDKIYFVVEHDCKYFLDEGEVGSIYKDEGGIWVSARCGSGLHYRHKEIDFGKTVFLTKEEAEQALKEREQGEC
jgi:hypothetical protein